MENQEELDENLPRNDGRVNDTTSEDNSYHNIHTTDVTIGAGCDASSRRLSGSQPAHNIPYMQLFHYLKQTFPDLKDCDINESIQKFGLNREKCEAELQQRSQGHMTGYYGPWGKGNCWSNRSSPATTRAPPPPAVGSEGAPITRGGVVVEQKARQEKLEAVLRESYKEKDSLLNEVQSLAESLKRSQREGQQAAANNDQRIEEMQEENCRLQAECDLIEREILQTGEEPEVLDHEYSRGATAVSPSSPLSPLQPHLNLTRGQPPGEHQTGRRLTPTRPAPPPPPQATSQPNFYHEQTESILQSGRWSCSRCTYDNHPDMTTCEICGAIRIPSSTSQQPSSGGLPSHTDQHHRSPPSLVRDQMR